MASICEVCGKGIQAGCNVSHSNRHSVVNGSVKRINVCTRCLRSGKVNRAI